MFIKKKYISIYLLICYVFILSVSSCSSKISKKEFMSSIIGVWVSKNPENEQILPSVDFRGGQDGLFDLLYSKFGTNGLYSFIEDGSILQMEFFKTGIILKFRVEKLKNDKIYLKGLEPKEIKGKKEIIHRTDFSKNINRDNPDTVYAQAHADNVSKIIKGVYSSEHGLIKFSGNYDFEVESSDTLIDGSGVYHVKIPYDNVIILQLDYPRETLTYLLEAKDKSYNVIILTKVEEGPDGYEEKGVSMQFHRDR